MKFSDALHQLVRKRHAFYVVSHERSGTHLALNLLYRNLHISQSFYDVPIWSGPYQRCDDADQHWLRVVAEWRKQPRRGGLIKTHVEAPVFRKFFPEAKVVYVTRDPRDTLVSFFYYLNSEEFHENNPEAGDHRCSSFSDFLRRPLSPFLALGFAAEGNSANVVERWASHVRSWMDGQGACIVRYEEMILDYRSVVARVARHVGAFPKLRQQSVPFGEGGSILPRKGIIGDWRSHFSTSDLEFLKATVVGYGMDISS